MLANHSKMRTLAREFAEAIARIIIGEPAVIVPKSALERLERLAYREQLRDAERNQDVEYIEAEIRRNQLKPEERKNLAKRHTPIENWPVVETDLIDPDLFTSVDERSGSHPR